ncbi:Uncharacterised protein [Vibrio cholerae]|nr:Uncharacterised protein [Vibrio cholerae]
MHRPNRAPFLPQETGILNWQTKATTYHTAGKRHQVWHRDEAISTCLSHFAFKLLSFN